MKIFFKNVIVAALLISVLFLNIFMWKERKSLHTRTEEIKWEMHINQLISGRNALFLANSLIRTGKYEDVVMKIRKNEAEKIFVVLEWMSFHESHHDNFPFEKIESLRDDFEKGDPWEATDNLSLLIKELSDLRAQ